MKRFSSFSRIAALFFAAVAILIPADVAAEGIFSGIVSEIGSDLPPGVSKVPVFGDGNSYEDCLSSKQKQDVVTYGKLADAAYGTEAPPAGCKKLSDQRIAQLLAGSENSYEIKNGTISLKGVKGGSGFNAMLFEDSSGKIVVAYRGTEGVTAPGDLWTDAVQIVGSKDGKTTTQYQASADVLKSVLANSSGEIVVTGHSLGGGLANYAMAANDLGKRVTGYTYNAAGLSEETLATLNGNRREAAASATINVRNEGDPVSYVGGHIGPTYEVANDDLLGAHGIGGLVDNLERTQGVDGTKQGTATTDYRDPIDQAASSLADALSTVMPADVAHAAAALLDEYARLALQAGADKLDAKIAAELDRIEKRLQKLMPGDLSSQALSKTIAELKKGNLAGAGDGLLDIGMGAAEDVIRDRLAAVGITGKDADAIVNGAKDAIRTAIEGGDVAGSVLGSVESYVYDKVATEIGKDAADKWMNVWEDIKAGNDPWENFQDAALATVTVKFEEFVDRTAKVIDKRLAELAAKHPEIGRLFGALGISGQSFAQGAKWIWGVLTGSGSLSEKFETIVNGAVKTLTEMVDKLKDYAFARVQEFLSTLVNKVAKKIVAVVNKAIAKINGWIGKANKWIDLINGYVKQIKRFAAVVNRVSARASKILVKYPGAPPSAGPILGPDGVIDTWIKKIDYFAQPLPTIPNVPTIPSSVAP